LILRQKAFDGVKSIDALATLLRGAYEIGRRDESKGISRDTAVRKYIK
jgi:hypothetical protein